MPIVLKGRQLTLKSSETKKKSPKKFMEKNSGGRFAVTAVQNTRRPKYAGRKGPSPRKVNPIPQYVEELAKRSPRKASIPGHSEARTLRLAS